MGETFEEKMARIKACGMRIIKKLEHDEKVAMKMKEMAEKELEKENG